jgi:hypothetical protein
MFIIACLPCRIQLSVELQNETLKSARHVPFCRSAAKGTTNLTAYTLSRNSFFSPAAGAEFAHQGPAVRVATSLSRLNLQPVILNEVKNLNFTPRVVTVPRPDASPFDFAQG